MFEDFIATHGMLISGSILIISYILIASEKIQKSVVALVGASLTLMFGLLPFHGYIDSQTGKYIKDVFGYISFDVIFLLIGMMIIVNIASRSGMFKWLALQVLN